MRGELVLVGVPQPLELGDVLAVHTVNLFLRRVGILHHHDGPADHDVDGSSIRHQPDVVVEDATRVEQRNGEAEDPLDEKLKLVDAWMRLRRRLLKDVVLAKCQHGHEVRAGAEGHLDEALAALENKSH